MFYIESDTLIILDKFLIHKWRSDCTKLWMFSTILSDFMTVDPFILSLQVILDDF